MTDGTAGTFTQAMGLAEAVGFKKIVPKIFKILFSVPFLPSLMPLWAKLFAGDSFTSCGPLPDVLIGCGRKVIPAMLYIKKNNPRTLCIYIMDPKIPSKYFDLIIAMDHDSIRGDNVITTPLAMNRINKIRCQTEVKRFKNIFKKYPRPYYTVLIGGNTKKYKMNKQACYNLLDKIDEILELCPGSVLITASRRTPPSILKALNNKKGPKVYVADLINAGQNPYFAMLGLAEKIFVTNDSVNMISEAYACKKAVEIIPLFGLKTGKSLKFLDALNKGDISSYKNNNKAIAKIVRDRLKYLTQDVNLGVL